MLEALQTVDQWFLILVVALLGMFFLWAVKNMFADLKGTINELKELIKGLTENHTGLDRRMLILEESSHKLEEEHIVFKQMFKSIAEEMKDLREEINRVNVRCARNRHEDRS